MIATNFGFMYSVLGRLGFIAILAFMSFTLSFLGMIAAVFLAAVAVYQVIVLFKYPKMSQYVRLKDYTKGSEASGPCRQQSVLAAVV